MSQLFALLLGVISPNPAEVVAPAPAAEQAHRADGGDDLSYEAVLLAAVERHPIVRAAVEGQGVAEAEVLADRGAFDPLVVAKAAVYPVGGYRSYAVGTEVRQYTPFWGITGYVGYRIGLGDFPVYRMEDRTLDRGEVRAGLRIPVIRDGPIDARRAALQKARIAVQRAKCEVRAEVLATAGDAARAYWAWVVTAAKRDVATVILAMARRRQGQIERGIALGARAEIEAADNGQLVADRSAKLADAERRYRNAVADLRYALTGTTLRIPDRPPRLPWFDEPPARISRPDVDADVRAALSARPDVCIEMRKREDAQVDLRLARNRMAPKLYADVGVSDDFGAGDPKLDPTELAVGVVFEVPLLLRAARGQRKAAERKVAAADAKIAAIAAKVRAELEKRHSDVVGTHERMVHLDDRRRAARRVMEAERTRFARGASSLVVVNLRELAYADATFAYLDAVYDHLVASAEYDLARGELPSKR